MRTHLPAQVASAHLGRLGPILPPGGSSALISEPQHHPLWAAVAKPCCWSHAGSGQCSGMCPSHKMGACSTKAGALMCQEGPMVYRPSMGDPSPKTGWLSVCREDPWLTAQGQRPVHPLPALQAADTAPCPEACCSKKKKKKNRKQFQTPLSSASVRRKGDRDGWRAGPPQPVEEAAR